MGMRSSLREDFVRVKTLVGLERFEVGKNSCRRPSDPAWTRLKFGQQVAYGYALIASPGFRARQNSYGFRAILSLSKISAEFSILRESRRNWFCD